MTFLPVTYILYRLTAILLTQPASPDTLRRDTWSQSDHAGLLRPSSDPKRPSR
jgi:hypothetical protein